ncbi:hypothetical protein AVEN_10945-1, partial [Araneus ventricosus]
MDPESTRSVETPIIPGVFMAFRFGMSKEKDDNLRSCASEYPISMESDSSNANGRASPMNLTQIPQT